MLKRFRSLNTIHCVSLVGTVTSYAHYCIFMQVILIHRE